MALSLIIAILLALTVGLITYQMTRRQAGLQIDSVTLELAEAKAGLSAAKALP